MTKWEIRLAIITGLLFTFNSLGTSIMVGLGNSTWSTMGLQNRFTMCVGIFVNWSGTMMAWMNRAITNLQRGQLPLPPTGSGDTSLLTKAQASATPTTMKVAIGLVAAGWLILLFGCTSFSTNLYRAEQVAVGAAYASYTGYTQALANATITLTPQQSNEVKVARLKFAASVGALETWRGIYETNSVAKPQAQAALDAVLLDSSNLVYVIHFFIQK